MLDRPELLEIIIRELGLRQLSTDEQGKIIRRIEANIASRINITILERLNEIEHEELLRVSETVGDLEVDKFLKSKIPDLDDLAKQVAVETVTEFKSLAQL